ncbi:MAG: peptidoglycan-binding protein [Ponticaulis sp.]|nr:peptidoglycan-binding protein [Ponticaulis sp.]
MTLKFAAAAVSVTALLAGGAFAQTADMPPSADPGECFARVLIPEITEVMTEQVIDTPERTEIKVVPATYETVTEQVLIKEATTESRIIPAVYETVTEQVLVKEASVELRHIPATYQTITEQVLIEAERVETKVVPATFETYTEQVLVRPAYTTWKPGAGLFGRGAVDGTSLSEATEVATGELLCRVEVPAEYDTVTRTRIATPEMTEEIVIPARYETVTKEVVATAPTVEEIEIPAVYETVEKRVVVSAATTEVIEIPAQYETVTVRQMVTPKTEETIVIPATYKTVEKRVVSGGGGLEWREVLCDTNTTSAKIMEVQQALTAAGYSNPADGSFGPQTLRAMESYQRANGLPVGYLTVSTVESLGVSPY